MTLSLQQAADATGKEKSTISRAIKSGRMSGVKTEKGNYEIDAAELFRVFPPKAVEDESAGAMQQNAPDEIASENRELKARVELLSEIVRKTESERDDLRRRLDIEGEERRRTQTQLTALLTDQRAKPEPPGIGLWQRLFRGG